MDLTWLQAIVLVCSGLVVGFINTLAGGGTIISISLLMFLGLPPATANGTNRIAVLAQNLSAVASFSKQKLIDWGKSLKLAIPIIVGSVLGAVIATYISNELFKYFFAGISVFIAIMLIFKPKRWLKEDPTLLNRRLQWWHYALFLFIGTYGGFIHVGVGYLILACLVLGTGNELVKANAIKTFLVLAYIPFSLVVFILAGHVNWTYGLIHAVGNVIGAQIGVRFAVKKGANFIRYIMIALIAVVILQLLGVI